MVDEPIEEALLLPLSAVDGDFADHNAPEPCPEQGQQDDPEILHRERFIDLDAIELAEVKA